jgi:hypothetical protein
MGKPFVGKVFGAEIIEVGRTWKREVFFQQNLQKKTLPSTGFHSLVKPRMP